MAINPVGSSVQPDTEKQLLQAKATEQDNAKKAANDEKVNKDMLVLSEKAKDLAAKKAGKSFEEEQNESINIQMKESE